MSDNELSVVDLSSTESNLRFNSTELSDTPPLYQNPGNAINDVETGQFSPVRARTMKEYDQQIDSLQKENFNLKLRIYFLEESAKKRHDGSIGDIFQLNIELQIELESLKKDLIDKTELLKKASLALDSLTSNHEEEMKAMQLHVEESSKMEIDLLKDEVNQLKQLLRQQKMDMEQASGELVRCKERIVELTQLNERLMEEKEKAKELLDKISTDLPEMRPVEKSSFVIDEEQVLAFEDELEKKNKLIEQLRCALKVKDVLMEQVESEKKEVELKFKVGDGDNENFSSHIYDDDDEEDEEYSDDTQSNDPYLVDPAVKEQYEKETGERMDVRLIHPNKYCIDRHSKKEGLKSLNDLDRSQYCDEKDQEKYLLESYVEKLSDRLKEREDVIKDYEKTIKNLENKCLGLMEIVEDYKTSHEHSEESDDNDNDGACHHPNEGMKSSWSQLCRSDDGEHKPSGDDYDEDDGNDEDIEKITDLKDIGDCSISYLQWKNLDSMTFVDNYRNGNKSRRAGSSSPRGKETSGVVSKRLSALEKENKVLKDRLWAMEQHFEDWKRDEEDTHVDVQKGLRYELQKTIEMKNNLEEQCSELEEELFMIKRHFEELGSFIVDFEGVEEDQKQMVSSSSSHGRDFSDRLTGLKEVFARQEALINEKQEALRCLEDKNVEVTKSFERNVKDLQNLKQSLVDKEAEIEKLNHRLETDVQTLLQELDSLKKNLIQRNVELVSSKNEKDQLELKLTDSEKNKGLLANKMSELENSNRHLSEKLNVSDSLGEQLNKLLKEGGEITKQLNAKITSLNAMNGELSGSLEQKCHDLADCEREILALRSSLEVAECSAKELNGLMENKRKLTEQLEEEIRKKDEIIEELNKKITSHEDLIGNLNSLLSQKHESNSVELVVPGIKLEDKLIEISDKKSQLISDIMAKKKSLGGIINEKDDLIVQWGDLVGGMEKEWMKEARDIKAWKEKWHIISLENDSLMIEKSNLEMKMIKELKRKDKEIEKLKKQLMTVVKKIDKSENDNSGCRSSWPPETKSFYTLKTINYTLDLHEIDLSDGLLVEKESTNVPVDANMNSPQRENEFSPQENAGWSCDRRRSHVSMGAISVALCNFFPGSEELKAMTHVQLLQLLSLKRNELVEISEQLVEANWVEKASKCIQTESAVSEEAASNEFSNPDFSKSNKDLEDYSEAFIEKLKFRLEKTQGDLDRANEIIKNLSEHIRLNGQETNADGAKEKSKRNQFNPEVIVRMSAEISTLRQRLASHNSDNSLGKQSISNENNSFTLMDGKKLTSNASITSCGTAPSELGQEKPQASQSSSVLSCTTKTSTANSECTTVSLSSNDQVPMTPIVQARARNKEAFDKLQEEICHLRYQFRRRVSCGPRPSFGRLSSVHSKSILAGTGRTSCSLGVEVSEGDTRHKLDFSRFSGASSDFNSTRLDSSIFEESRRDSFVVARSSDDLLLADLLAESEGRCRVMRDRLEELMAFLKTLLDNSELSAFSKKETSKISNCLDDTSFLLEDFSLWLEERKEILDNSSTSESRKSLAARASLIGRPSLVMVLEDDEPIEDGGEGQRNAFDPARAFRSPVSVFAHQNNQCSESLKSFEDGSEISSLKEKLAEVTEQSRDMEASINVLRSQLSAYQERCERLTQDLVISERNKKELFNHVECLKHELQQGGSCLEKLEQYEEELSVLRNEKSSKDEEVDKLKIEVAELIEKLESSTMDAVELEEKVKFFQEEAETWRSKISENEEFIVSMSGENRTLRSSLKEAESSVSQLNGQLHESSLCKQAVSQRLQEVEKDLDELLKALKLKESVIDQLTFENTDLRSQLEGFEHSNAEKLAVVTADLERIQFEWSEKEEEFKSQSARIESLTKDLMLEKEISSKLTERKSDLLNKLEQLKSEIKSLTEEVQGKTKKLMDAECRVVEFQTNCESLDHKLNIVILERDSLVKRLEDEKAAFEKALGAGISTSQNLFAFTEVERLKLLKADLDVSHVSALEEKNQSLELKLKNQSVELKELSHQLNNLNISSPRGQQQTGLCCADLKEELELVRDERDALARKVLELSRKSSLLTSEIVSSSSGGSENDVSFCGLKKCQDKCNRLEKYIYELKELLAKNTCAAQEMREQLHVLNTELKQKKLTINRLETSLKEAQTRSSLSQQLLPRKRVGDRGAGESNFSESQAVIDELQKLNKMLKMELNLVRQSKSTRTIATLGNDALVEDTTGSYSAENKENIKLVDVDTPNYTLKTSLHDASTNSNNNNMNEEDADNDPGETDWSNEVARIRLEFQELVESNQELRQKLETCSKGIKTSPSFNPEQADTASSVTCDHSGFYREIEGLKRQIAELRSLQPTKGPESQSKPRYVKLGGKINQSEVIKEINKTRKILAQTTMNLGGLARHQSEKSPPAN